MIYKLEESDQEYDDDDLSEIEERRRQMLLSTVTRIDSKFDKPELKLQRHLPMNRPVDVKVIVYIVKVSRIKDTHE